LESGAIEVFRQAAAANSREKYQYRYDAQRDLIRFSYSAKANNPDQFKPKAAIASMTRWLSRL